MVSPMERVGIIYCARNEVNLKSYIGQTVQSLEARKIQHFSQARIGSDCHFHKSIRKHGEDAFVWYVLESGIPFSNLGNREVFWIATLNTFLHGYNATTGGEDSFEVSDEAIEKLKKSHQQRIDDGTHHLLGESNPSHHRIEEGTHNFQGEKHPMRIRAANGTHLWQSDEHRKRMCEQNPMSNPETVQKKQMTESLNRYKAQTDAGQQFCIDITGG